jgi:hypothetical protein
MPDNASKTTRFEVADLYFWLGEEAERVGFTPWQTAWLVAPIDVSTGECRHLRPAETSDLDGDWAE